MSERGFFSASNDIKTLDGNIFSGFPWLTDAPNHPATLPTAADQRELKSIQLESYAAWQSNQ